MNEHNKHLIDQYNADVRASKQLLDLERFHAKAHIKAEEDLKKFKKEVFDALTKQAQLTAYYNGWNKKRKALNKEVTGTIHLFKAEWRYEEYLDKEVVELYFKLKEELQDQ